MSETDSFAKPGASRSCQVPLRSSGSIGCRLPITNRVFLFPLDCCRRFGGDVVDNAVDAANFVDDLIGGLGKEFVGEMHPVGGHAVGGDYGA